jgi:hypothetical protein
MAQRSSNGTRNLADFPIDLGLSKPQRIAAFLDWWATKHPFDFAAYNEILKAIEGYKRMPRMDTEEVAHLQGRIGSAEKLLQNQYKRALIRQRGLGARASVDSADALDHKQVGRVRTMERAIAAVQRGDELINLKEIPDSPTKRWYSRDVKVILKQFEAPDALARLLPPAMKEKSGQ